jgi:putative ABC transport system substrate-binding protein
LVNRLSNACLKSLALKSRSPIQPLISYGADFQDNFGRSAQYVNDILRGAKPSELPVQMSVKYLLIINLKTAKALGITVPQTLLVVADEVIQ